MNSFHLLKEDVEPRNGTVFRNGDFLNAWVESGSMLVTPVGNRHIGGAAGLYFYASSLGPEHFVPRLNRLVSGGNV
jgi:hypothetical protein